MLCLSILSIFPIFKLHALDPETITRSSVKDVQEIATDPNFLKSSNSTLSTCSFPNNWMN